MLIIKSTSYGKDNARVFVTDCTTSEMVAGITDIATSDMLVGAIRADANSITLDIVRKKLGLEQDGNKMDKVIESRDRHNIVVHDDGSVTLPSGNVLPNAFRRMLNTVSSDRDIKAVIAFGDKLSQNPLEHAREALIEWIILNPSLALTRDGDVIGYRGLREDFTSVHSGYGIVNGVHLEDANLDNTPGNVIEFPREMIDHNPNNRCSVGLHVGTYKYADNFNRGRKVFVTFSPADVVSPPTDAHQEKIRVSKMISRSEIYSALPEERIIIDLDNSTDESDNNN